MILIIAHGLLKLDETIKCKIWCHYFDQLPPSQAMMKQLVLTNWETQFRTPSKVP